MDLSEIFSEAIWYPFSDIPNFMTVGIIAMLSSMPSIIASFGINDGALSILAGILSFIFVLFLSGYAVSVIKNGIDGENDFPYIDLRKNFLDGIKSWVIGIVYCIIPILIALVLAVITGAIGAGIDHMIDSLGIFAIIAVIIFAAFAIFEIIALARFADSNELMDALNIGEVIGDVKRVGIINVILFVIMVFFVILVAAIVSAILGFIPFVGVIISSLVVGAFIVLFFSKALGLLYGSA